MTPEEARNVVREVLCEVAPEADPEHIGRDVTLLEALGFDSLDFLDFVAGLHQRTGVEIVERDYPRLLTIDDCVAYLVSATRPAAN
jgi:acyl carrier protein